MLPSDHRAGLELGLSSGGSVYLVGGIVRDLVLGRANLDLDFVSLTPAIELARQLLPRFAQQFGTEAVKLTEHSAFGTARLEVGDKLHLDFATARREIYAHPAALPTVTFPATLQEDMGRRDFTINALALSPSGDLYDPFGGLQDLRAGILRVLHPRSFIDDPTRMIRGVRFAARFDFSFEAHTAKWLEEARVGGYFGLLSAERKRNELRLILKEIHPAKGLALLEKYKLLTALHPFLEWDEQLAATFPRTSQADISAANNLAILLHKLGAARAEQVVNDLRFAGIEGEIPIAVARLWETVRPQLQANLKNSQLYNLLHEYNFPALLVFELLLDEPERKIVGHYRDEVAGRKPLLTGDDLIRLGQKPGPPFCQLLADLREAVLDGEIAGREAEETFLRQQIAQKLPQK